MKTAHRSDPLAVVVEPDRRGGARSDLVLEDVWDRHGRAVYSLACALLGDEEAAAETMKLAMADLAELPEDATADDTHRSWARCVYLRSKEIADDTAVAPPPARSTTFLGQLAQVQRACVALCLFGGHTYREVANLLDVHPMTVAELLTSGLAGPERLGGSGSAAHA